MSAEQNVSELEQEHENSENFEQDSGKRKREDLDGPSENLSEEADLIKKIKSEQDTAETTVNVVSKKFRLFTFVYFKLFDLFSQPSVVPTTTPLSQVSFPLAGSPTPITIAATGAQETILIEISQEKVGQVIGSKGAIIQEIQMRTGAKAYYISLCSTGGLMYSKRHAC
jgi:hypothetical protein